MGLKKGAFNFLPLKRGSSETRVHLRGGGGGLNSGLTVAYDVRNRRRGTKFLQRRFYGQLSLTNRYFCSAGSRLDKEGTRSSGP